MARIGFIGVGNMGGPMSANLSKAQHQVRAFDLSPEAVAAAEAAGATAAPTVAEAVKDAEIVVTMLPAGAHVREVYMGEDGIFANAPKGTLFIDSSTIDVATSRDVAAAAKAAGFAMQSGLAAQHFNDAGKVLSAAAHIGEEGVQRLGF